MTLKPTLLALALVCGLANAVTLRVANQGDVGSMDPHSLNESLQLSFDSNIYESLVGRGKDMSVVPLLATKWAQTSPTVWRFELRKGVKFHDGTPFTAADVNGPDQVIGAQGGAYAESPLDCAEQTPTTGVVGVFSKYFNATGDPYAPPLAPRIDAVQRSAALVECTRLGHAFQGALIHNRTTQTLGKITEGPKSAAFFAHRN